MRRRAAAWLALLALCCALGGTASARDAAARTLTGGSAACPAQAADAPFEAVLARLREMAGGAAGPWRYRVRLSEEAPGLLYAEAFCAGQPDASGADASGAGAPGGETVRTLWQWEDGAWRMVRSEQRRGSAQGQAGNPEN